MRCPRPAAPAAAPAAAGAAQSAGHALAHRDNEGRREEDADLAELDSLGVVVIARGAQDDQPHPLVVGFDLRPHVEVLRVLDRQLMQAEGVANLGQLLFPRLEQPEPDKAVLRAPGRRLGQRHRAFVAPAAVLIVSAVNDHLRGPPSLARTDIRFTAWLNPPGRRRPQGLQAANRKPGQLARAIMTYIPPRPPPAPASCRSDSMGIHGNGPQVRLNRRSRTGQYERGRQQNCDAGIGTESAVWSISRGCHSRALAR